VDFRDLELSPDVNLDAAHAKRPAISWAARKPPVGIAYYCSFPAQAFFGTIEGGEPYLFDQWL
jgi:hypothetical protein